MYIFYIDIIYLKLLYKKPNNDIILTNFASNGANHNYHNVLFELITKLRNIFNISQKISLVNEKLRKFFIYWLKLCNKKLKLLIF